MAEASSLSKIPPSSDSNADFLSNKPLYHERHVRIICIGAGASGLILAYKLRRSFKRFELVVYEKNEGVGGTWFENTYPGFEPKPDWSSVYSSGQEIQQYFEDFSGKYELKQFIKFKHQVTKAVWDEIEGKWKVDVQRLDDGQIIHDGCDIFVNASGSLNAWKWPDIPGLDLFKGSLIHTAKWDKNVELQDKNVGVIGNGSSAIQVLPAIYPTVRTVTNFIRSPTWISPPFSEPQREYTPAEILKFEEDPQHHLASRKAQATASLKIWPGVLKDSDMQKYMTLALTQVLKEKLPPHLVEDLIPRTGVGCRRVTPGSQYLEALSGEKTRVVVGGIQRVTEVGVVDAKGVEHALDVLICATGFNTTFIPRFEIVGPNGVSMQDAWKDGVKGYMGVGAAEFPNYFTIGGAGSPVAFGPPIVIYELHADYILKMVDRYQTENVHSIAPKAEAVEDYNNHRDEFMKRTIWDGDCRSWYKPEPWGKVVAPWPGSGLHWYTVFKQEPRYEDWEWKYKGNRFLYLGNGYAQLELQDSDHMDWASFIRNEDDDSHLSRSARIAAIASKKVPNA